MKSWLLALRPKTLSAAVVPILVGTALVYAEGHQPDWWMFVCALMASLFIQIGTNFVNDAIDFKKGADTHERIGPQRVTQSGLLTGKQVMLAGFVCFFIALLFGIPIVLKGGMPFIIIGLISLFLGYSYTGGPFPLAYLGLGDIFVILFFGLIAVGGMYYLHILQLNMSAIIAGLQVGLLATVLIAINNLRDVNQDVKANKKTLPVRFGVTFGRVEIFVLFTLVYNLQFYWFFHGYEIAALLPLITAPLAISIIKGVFKEDPSPKYNKFLAQSGGVHLIYGILFSIGLILI